MTARIVILSTSISLGGADQQVIYLTRSLISKGYQVKVIALIPLGVLGIEAKSEGLPLYSLGMTRGIPDPRALLKLHQWLRDWQTDVLITFMVHATLIGRVARYLNQVPVFISSIRNEKVGGQLVTRLFRASNWMDDACVANAKGSAMSLSRQGWVSDAKLRVIPNGVQLVGHRLDDERQGSSKDRGCIREGLGIAETAFVWLAIGRLEPSKDYPNLLNAFSQIAASDMHLLIAGDGDLKGQLQALANDLKIADRVSFLGWRRDIPELFEVSDALVLSSAWEGMPNVVMEALYLAKPVVATQVGGVPELVQDGDSGFLVPPGDAIALSKAMHRLLRLSPSQRQTMGRSGHVYIKEHYSVEKISDLWEALCLELLAKKRGSSGVA